MTTEFGESLARKRSLLLVVPQGSAVKDPLKFVVKAATSRPLGTVVKEEKDSKSLIWQRPWKLVVETGIPREPMLPHVVGHCWWTEESERENVHGLGGPGRWPRVKNGKTDILWVLDRKGPSGCLRALSFEEVWLAQGRRRQDRLDLLNEGFEEAYVYNQGNLATGGHTAMSILTAIGSFVAEEMDGGKAGACSDRDGEEALAKLLIWLRKWKQGDLDRSRRKAGGGSLGEERKVWLRGATEWWDALRFEAKGEDVRTAGGRRKKGEAAATAAERASSSLVGAEEAAQKLPFDGAAVGLHLEEWIEANIVGDKADSTEKLYKSMWGKWVAWAHRQGWDSEYIGPKQDRIEAENRIIGFISYLGWLGGSAATVKQALFAIKARHKRAGAGDPTEHMHRLWILVNALDRRAERRPRRLGVTPGMLKWLGRQLEMEASEGEARVDCLAMSGALLTGWFFMLRAKEFLDSSGVDEAMILRGCDVKFTRGGEIVSPWEEPLELTIQFRKTKTDQECFGMSKTLASTGVKHLCVVGALNELRKVVPQRFGQGCEALRPLFRWSSGKVIKRTEVQCLLQRAAKAEGLPPERFLSHSLRIGGASALFQATGEIEAVKRMGRWTSSAVQRYLHDGGETAEYAKRMARAAQVLHYT